MPGSCLSPVPDPVDVPRDGTCNQCECQLQSGGVGMSRSAMWPNERTTLLDLAARRRYRLMTECCYVAWQPAAAASSVRVISAKSQPAVTTVFR